MKFHFAQYLKMAIALSAAMALCDCSKPSAAANLHPIILIPGSGGNQLEARLTEKYNPSSLLCNRWYPVKKDPDGWFRIWFDPTVLFGPFTKCFSQRMMVYYDPVEDDYHNAPGVETRVPHFGSTQALLYLDPNLKHITSYMQPLLRALEQIGYESGKTLFGAPYDFRYAPAADGHPSQVASLFLSDLKDLIESASTANSGRPVILLSHSMGGPYALHLLNRAPLPWAQKFVKHLITLSAPWGGTVGEMLTFASGYSLGLPFVDPLLVRAEQRSNPSNLWLLPSPSVFDLRKPLVVTPGGNYSSGNIAKFLEDIGFPEGVGPYETRVRPLVERVAEPRVPTTCVVGTGVETPETLFYYGGFDEGAEVAYGDGDGTVNMASLVGLEMAWGNRSVKVVRVRGVSHTELLSDERALGEVIGEVGSINGEGPVLGRVYSY